MANLNEKFLVVLMKTIANEPSRENLANDMASISQRASSIMTRYDVISRCIYEYDDEEIENVKRFFKDDVPLSEPSFQRIQKELDDNGKSYNIEVFGKFQKHVNLACIQREFISNNMIEAREMAKEASEVASEASGIKTKIYSEFIAILGIFTAISFAMMGSLQLLGTIFNDVSNPTDKKLGYIMEAGGIYLVIMSLLIFVLFVGMRKILGGKGKTWVWVSIIVVVISGLLFSVGFYLSR
ncbi:hypothetical protein [Lactococcus cremoris]|uniref:hypothetical protein n=1 Tax=Lactococcus lactis subsp. cremoris TaxID=1359 RepID=UPI002182420B|nr:hypothetical protein [Lactococcus cremoris]MCT0476411.1 hypothetical protein [Lactococcus cremoris]